MENTCLTLEVYKTILKKDLLCLVIYIQSCKHCAYFLQISYVKPFLENTRFEEKKFGPKVSRKYYTVFRNHNLPNTIKNILDLKLTD